MLLATGVLGTVSLLLDDEQFAAWGWRVPFLVSFVLIFVGFYIRRKVAESPAFEELKKKGKAQAPLRQLFGQEFGTVLKAALAFAGNNAAGYMIVGGFILGYTTTTLEMNREMMLLIITVASISWIFTTLLSGSLSDRIGRKPTYLIGYVLQFVWVIPMFLAIDTANPWLILCAVLVYTVSLGLTYGLQSAMFAEMFPAHIRLSGVSIAYAVGAIVGGAFSPMIAQLLVGETGWLGSVGVYLMVMAVISIIAVLSIGETRGAPLTQAEEDEQPARA